MKKFLNQVKNWRTTCAGTLSGLPVLIEGLSTGNWHSTLMGLGMLLTGIFARDGGTGSDQD